ncbi:hypothetical protein [Nitrosomonas nitrosa]|uniref:hypothetical protein n=1 Tax=Nitrosomonas nitrosa TaxID=52442 RepID=UPI000D2F971D|nr:hypothetical protein [Nitrosomonas nitrosa]
MMKRMQIFEFTDLPWWPEVLRSLLTDFLELLMKVTQPFSPKISLLTEVMKETKQTRFVDLCSGSGGPWLSLIKDLQKISGENISILLTDKYPNSERAKKLNPISGLNYFPYSVDALAVPSDLKGIRTLFNGFHHFPPDYAFDIINDAVKNDQPIVVFEILQRTWFDFFYFMLTPINLLLLTPWVQPRSITRLILTYLIPIAPIVVSWDSLVSILRCYTPEELMNMAHQTNAKHYIWKTGKYRHKGLPVTFLVGYPAKEK